MGEGRLSDLASIASKRQFVGYNDVINNFARMKPTQKGLSTVIGFYGYIVQ